MMSGVYDSMSGRALEELEDLALRFVPYVRFRESSDLIIFLHGLGSSSKACWGIGKGPSESLVDFIAADSVLSNASLICVDWQGTRSSNTWSLPDATNWVFSILESAIPDISQIPNVIFVAHSMGGLIALDIVARWKNVGWHQTRATLALIAVPENGSEYARIPRGC